MLPLDTLLLKLQSTATSLILGIRSHCLSALRHGGLRRVPLGGPGEHAHRGEGAVHDADSFISNVRPNIRPVKRDIFGGVFSVSINVNQLLPEHGLVGVVLSL